MRLKSTLLFGEKSKSEVKLNFGLSPNFSVQLKVSLAKGSAKG